MDLISDTLCQVVDAAELTRNVHSNAAWRNAAEGVVHTFSDYISRLNVNVGLYNALCGIMASPSARQFNEEQHRVCDSLKEEFERDGLHLQGTDRDESARLTAAVAQLGVEFAHGSQHAPRVFEYAPASSISDLPHGYLTFLPPQGNISSTGPMNLSTHPALVHGVLTFAKDARLRERMLVESWSQNASNLPTLQRLVAARAALANRAGCGSYADYITRHRLAGSPQVLSDVYSIGNKVAMHASSCKALYMF